MKPLLRAAGRTLLCAFVLLTQPVWAAQPWEEYSKLIKSRERITAEGPQLFGDAVNLYTGELSFAVSDVSIPGNNNLPAALGRKYAVPGEGIPNLPMGDWDIDIPYLGGPSSITRDGTSIPPSRWRAARLSQASHMQRPSGQANILRENERNRDA